MPGGRGCPGLSELMQGLSPSLRMGLEVCGVISPVSNDLQSRVGQSLTSLAALSAEETPGSVWAPSLGVT